MKKLILSIGIFSFILFGVVAVQNVGAAINGVDIMVVDQDPDEDKDKKAAAKKAEDNKVTLNKVDGECKDAKASCKSAEAKACCKTADAKACCKSAEAKSCESKCPDKK